MGHVGLSPRRGGGGQGTRSLRQLTNALRPREEGKEKAGVGGDGHVAEMAPIYPLQSGNYVLAIANKIQSGEPAWRVGLVEVGNKTATALETGWSRDWFRHDVDGLGHRFLLLKIGIIPL